MRVPDFAAFNPGYAVGRRDDDVFHEHCHGGMSITRYAAFKSARDGSIFMKRGSDGMTGAGRDSDRPGRLFV